MRVQIYKNPQFGDIRTFNDENNNPLFVAVDVAKILGYKNPAEAIATHCKSGDIEFRYIPHSNGIGGTNLQVINEANLYRLIMKSHMSDAELFQDWVVEEVLPSIRKTGGYILTNDNDTDETIMARALIVANQTLENHKQRVQMLEAENELQRKELKSLIPKAQYVDEVLQSKSTFTTTQIAKGLNTSAITLNKKLFEMGIQFYQSEQWFLKAKYQNKGLTDMRISKYIDTKKNEIKTSQSLVWTEKGRQFIHQLFDNINEIKNPYN